MGTRYCHTISIAGLRHGAIPNSYSSDDCGLYNFRGRSVATIYRNATRVTGFPILSRTNGVIHGKTIFISSIGQRSCKLSCD
jgi:hypothetical protein